MANTYKKPETKVIHIESHLMDTVSKGQFGGAGGGTDGQEIQVNSKGFDFFAYEEEEETPGKSDDDDSWDEFEDEEY